MLHLPQVHKLSRLNFQLQIGCRSLGFQFRRVKEENPKAIINSKEAAYYFKIFREFHPQDSILGSIGIWTGFDFAEERERVRGTVDGDLKHDHGDEKEEESKAA